jgi:malonyl-CoA O-methyltransferase
LGALSILSGPPDKRWVAHSFGSAASAYDGVAVLQRSVGQNLIQHLPTWSADGFILDVGAGTGYFARVLDDLYPSARVVALDIAEGMLRCARERFSGACLGGDAEALPLATGSIDLIFSNLAIQWCTSPVSAFREFHRVLRPGGYLLFSTFGPMTLQELRRAWTQVDAFSHVNEFSEMKVLELSLSEAGFSVGKLDATVIAIEYLNVMSLMRELKTLGARNLTAERPRHLTGKDAMARMISAYPCQDLTGSTSIHASFEVITGFARRSVVPGNS